MGGAALQAPAPLDASGLLDGSDFRGGGVDKAPVDPFAVVDRSLQQPGTGHELFLALQCGDRIVGEFRVLVEHAVGIGLADGFFRRLGRLDKGLDRLLGMRVGPA